MSIIAYYARLNAGQIPLVDADPSILEVADVSMLPGAEVIDLDKAWGGIAWLASPLKRAEDDHNHNAMQMFREPIAVPKKPTLFDRLLGRKVDDTEPAPDVSEDLRKRSSELAEMLPDAALIAIEGRTLNRLQSEVGYGPPAVFAPDEVKSLANALQSISEDGLQRAYDPKRMDEVMVQPGYWLEEGDDLMATYILPSFRRLQKFYTAAAAEGQAVLVWHA